MAFLRKGAFVVQRTELGDELVRENPTAWIVYQHLKGWANYVPGRGRRGDPIQTGQFPFSVRGLAEALNLSTSTLQSILRYLVRKGLIVMNACKRKGTIATVVNYCESQRMGAGGSVAKIDTQKPAGVSETGTPGVAKIAPPKERHEKNLSSERRGEPDRGRPPAETPGAPGRGAPASSGPPDPEERQAVAAHVRAITERIDRLDRRAATNAPYLAKRRFPRPPPPRPADRLLPDDEWNRRRELALASLRTEAAG